MTPIQFGYASESMRHREKAFAHARALAADAAHSQVLVAEVAPQTFHVLSNNAEPGSARLRPMNDAISPAFRVGNHSLGDTRVNGHGVAIGADMERALRVAHASILKLFAPDKPDAPIYQDLEYQQKQRPLFQIA